ncbi:MAG: hypothetical protein DI551_00755 [Micavibrio aeruginosavorus]|uniref:Uncharacterized protein n=1 Tax=Micavibrio aeruginosavorus TaxID=349221 RepID=A0A2W5Q2A7_9BACT|nr:MAG: hypothetical protein DI551_00755 [Micavibrio aeruginosavorus]
MALAKLPQTNFTSGVLDPKLAAREDITFYYNALKNAVNLLVMPQGGAYGRPGLEFIRPLSNILAPIPTTGSTASAPHGGAAGNALDGDSSTSLTTDDNLAATNNFVIFHIAFAAAVPVSAIDILDYRLESLALSDEIFMQYSNDNASFTTFGTAIDWDAAPRSRRLRDAADTVAARYWRLIRIGTTNIAAKAVVADIKFWSETDDLSNIRLVPFAYSTEEAYMMACTDRCIDVFKGVSRTGSIGIPHSSAQLPTLNWTSSFDTLILFQKSVRPQKIFRQGGDDEFDFRDAAFKNIPSYDYGAGTGGVNEVQRLYVSGLGDGSSLTLLLEGERSERIVRGTGETTAAVAAKMQTALRALPNTSASGITVTAASGYFEVTFAGDDGKQPWDEISITVLDGDSVWSVQRFVKGKYPGEDIMSDSRGWPRCGLFDQERLQLGGITGVPDAHLASTTTDYYDFDIDIDNDTKALMFRAQTDKINAIYNIVRGQHLSLFTSGGEFFYPSEILKEDSSPKRSSGCGSKEGMRVHEVDGALIYTQGVRADGYEREKATSLREFIYEETRQRYDSNLISKLSSHLIRNPSDDALRKALSTDDADIQLQVNEDGTGTAFTTLRADSVNALMPLATRGGDLFRAVGVDEKQRVYWAVQRTIGGIKKNFLECWNEKLLLDCGGIETILFENAVSIEDGQATFGWSFDSPDAEEEIGVRINMARLDPSQYSVDLDAQSITLSDAAAAGIAEGDVVRIALMRDRVDGLFHLEGETLKTVIDGTEGGSFKVVGGILILDDFADTEIQYGFDYEVSGAVMPLRVPDSETLAGEKVRVVNAQFELYQTGGIEIRANNGAWQEIGLVKTDEDILDRSTAEMLYTGSAEKRGLLGHAVGAPLEFRRPGPTPFCVLGVLREVSL